MIASGNLFLEMSVVNIPEVLRTQTALKIVKNGQRRPLVES